MTNRIHIDAPAGVIEIEGERDFVEGLLSKLFPLIEEVGFGSRSKADKGPEHAAEDDVNASSEASPAEENGKAKPKRRRAGNPPRGQSCADRIIALKADGFLKDPKGAADIVAGLGAKGWKHKTNQVAAAGESLFKRGLIQRTKEGNGPWKYYWDRD